MSRLKFALILVLAVPAAARAACNLQMTVTCNSQGACTATTVNAGSESCSGEYYVGFESLGGGNITAFDSGLGFDECFSSTEFPGMGIPPFSMCFGETSLAPNASFTSNAQVSTPAGASVSVLAFTGVYDPVTFEEKGLAYATNDGSAAPTCTPSISAGSQVQSNQPYSVSWTAVSDPNTTYEVQESTSADFTAAVTSRVVSGLSTSFQHSATAPTAYFYRVRASSCGGSAGPFSAPTIVIVLAEPAATNRDVDVVVPFGSSTPVDFKIFIPGPPAGLRAMADPTFTTSVDKSYLKVTPSTGTIPPGGTTLTVTATPTGLSAGGNTGTVTVTSNNATVKAQSVTVSLVTPVGPGTKSVPSSNTLIIPVVTHVNSSTAQFLSDVRLTNASSSEVKYQLTFTPTRSDATKASKVTTVPVGPAQTVALNDVAKDFFGFGATGKTDDVGFGSLEIRPLGSGSALNYASSRTYAVNSLGTFGQFIAAVPFSKFATKMVTVPPIGGAGGGTSSANILSFQQVAQSSKFRTNLGIVEGSGTSASGRIRVLDDAGTLLKELPFSLLPGEHQQLNRFIKDTAGIDNLEDGRIEIVVDSSTGAVSGYASVLDNLTDDPLAVMPVAASDVSASRYVLPGMADLPGTNNFRSDIRIYNGGKSSVTVTPTYYPQNSDPSKPIVSIPGQPFTIEAGKVKSVDNVLPTIFNVGSSGGSIVLTTSSNTSLVATGRTYTVKSNGGTFGQFIPGVSPKEGIGAGDNALQILQLEQSRSFRSNVGLAELTGNPVELEIVATLPDSKSSPVLKTTLQGNEFKQFLKLIEQMVGPGTNTYNARVSVKVISGTGRVAAYGSVIDNDTGDPTYVPAQ